MASPGPNARTGQSRDHGGQALLGSQASARQSLTARRSRAVDRSRERHGWSIGVRVRPHRAPCGASLPVGRSVFEFRPPGNWRLSSDYRSGLDDRRRHCGNSDDWRSFSSFTKRRMTLVPGSMALGLDQIPESLLPAIACRWMLPVTALDIVLVAALFFAGELVVRSIYVQNQRPALLRSGLSRLNGGHEG